MTIKQRRILSEIVWWGFILFVVFVFNLSASFMMGCGFATAFIICKADEIKQEFKLSLFWPYLRILSLAFAWMFYVAEFLSQQIYNEEEEG
jgi:energy-coupling factor transporter transmembrane protein EcfT